MLLAASTATPVGKLTVAFTAKPPSPLNPEIPLPAMVVILVAPVASGAFWVSVNWPFEALCAYEKTVSTSLLVVLPVWTQDLHANGKRRGLRQVL